MCKVFKFILKLIRILAVAVGALFAVYFWNLDQKLLGWAYVQDHFNQFNAFSSFQQFTLFFVNTHKPFHMAGIMIRNFHRNAVAIIRKSAKHRQQFGEVEGLIA